MEKKVELLDWDSKILGFSVAKIVASSLTNAEISEILADLRAKKVHLVYWAAGNQTVLSPEILRQYGGFLADHKLTYALDLNELQKNTLLPDLSEVYSESLPNKELIHLALDSGAYSRFKMDSGFTQAQFEKIYTQWITNSTNGSIAEQVSVIKKDGKLAAMATLGEKNQRGDIGLLAVAEEFRGMKLGSSMVDAALRFFIARGYAAAQVVTQEENVPACRLYESRGFVLEKQENFYHFWL
jgi:dTDP-4-amino-4,6-dideoxy-D-galactose acyltransferase